MAITGLRVSPLDGTQAHLAPPSEAPYDASKINGARVASPPVSLPSGKVVTYRFPHLQVIQSVYIEVYDGSQISYDWKLYYTSSDFFEENWQEVPYAARLHNLYGLSEDNGLNYVNGIGAAPIKRMRLDVSALSDPKIAAFHVYRMSPGNSAQERSDRPLMLMDEPRRSFPYPRKTGEFFDDEEVGRSGSSKGQFALYNWSSQPCTAPVLQAHSPGDDSSSPVFQHMLFSVDRLRWSSQLQLPTIPAGESSPTIYYINNTPAAAPLGRTTVHVSVGATGAQPKDTSVFAFYKTVTADAPTPDIWFTDRVAVESGAQVTVFGRGLQDATWSVWNSLSGWATYGWAPWLTPHAATMSAGDQTNVVLSATSTPTFNVEVESATFNIPSIEGSSSRRFAIRVARPDGEDIHHWVRVNALLRGDLGLPPMLLKSTASGVFSQVGLTPGGGIAQESMSFSTPEMIVAGDTVRARPEFLVDTHTSCVLTGTSTIDGLIQPQQDIIAPGMVRFYPAETYLEPDTEMGGDVMWWWSTDHTRRMSFRTSTGVFIDPQTDFDTVDPSTQIQAPSMVFSGDNSSARMSTHFGNVTLSNGWVGGSMTALMVVLIGPDPSPTYEEVALGVQPRLTSLPARLMGGYATPNTGHIATMHYSNRTIHVRSGSDRITRRIDTHRLGVRPVIIGMTIGARNRRGKLVDYTRMTYGGDVLWDSPMSQTKFAPDMFLRIGHPSLVGSEFRVLDVIVGPQQTSAAENKIRSQLDSIYGVIGR